MPRFLNHQYGGDWNATLILFAAMHVAALLFWLPLNPNGVIGERAAVLRNDGVRVMQITHSIGCH